MMKVLILLCIVLLIQPLVQPLKISVESLQKTFDHQFCGGCDVVNCAINI